ncbi:MAG: PadR family transcriptional regulator [Candidatus Bathyarchaeia archaeon]|jgi:DNA-binding PadR family transcriptional regulator
MTDKWIKRAGGVPRGLLRFLVLNMLVKKPMSGAEIVEVIEEETGGRWKPSSGSVYPLLARLQEKGFTTEQPSDETGMKRYTLTDKGKVLFEKQISFGQTLMDKLEFLVPMLIGGFQFAPNDEKILSGVKEPAKRVVMALLELRAVKQSRLTEQHSKQIEEILNKSAEELEGIVKKINETK